MVLTYDITLALIGIILRKTSENLNNCEFQVKENDGKSSFKYSQYISESRVNCFENPK